LEEALSLVALSIRQPWVHAILFLGKDIENRSWPTTYRGRVLIHASSKMPTKDDMMGYRATLRSAGIEDPGIDRKGFAVGGFVGTVEIVSCVREHHSPWFFGDFGFVLRNPKPQPLMPFRGMLGFFDVPEGVVNFYLKHHGINIMEDIRS